MAISVAPPASEYVPTDPPLPPYIGGVHHDDHDGEFGNLRRGDLQRCRVVAGEKAAYAAGAERTIEVRSRGGAGSARAGRIVCAESVDETFMRKYIDRRFQLVERRRGRECGNEGGAGVVEIVLLCAGKTSASMTTLKARLRGADPKICVFPSTEPSEVLIAHLRCSWAELFRKAESLPCRL